MPSYQGGSDVSGGGFVSEEGLYHFVISRIDDKPTNKDNVPLDNAFFTAYMKVVASTVKGQEEKEHRQTFYFKNESHRDGGAFSQKILDRFFLAVGVLTPETIGEQVNFEWEDLVGRQLLAKIKKNNKGYADIEGASTFHVDDPDASGYPKNDAYLKMIPAPLRWKKGATVPQTAKEQPAPQTTRPMSDDDIPF